MLDDYKYSNERCSPRGKRFETSNSFLFESCFIYGKTEASFEKIININEINNG